jgi:hypothetical protein
MIRIGLLFFLLLFTAKCSLAQKTSVYLAEDLLNAPGVQVNDGVMEVGSKSIKNMYCGVGSFRIKDKILKGDIISLSLTIDLNTINDFDVGIIALRQRDVNLLPYLTAHLDPEHYLNRQLLDSVAVFHSRFTSRGDEERYYLLIKNKDGHKPTKKKVLIRNFELDVSLELYSPQKTLIENGDFEQYYFLKYLSNLRSFDFTNSIPYWNEESYVDSKRFKMSPITLLESDAKDSGMNSNLDISAFHLGTPDYYAGDSLFHAYSGNSCVGINVISVVGGKVQRGREYLVTKLMGKLTKGETYSISFAYKAQVVGGSECFPSTNLGIALTDSMLYRLNLTDLEYPLASNPSCIKDTPEMGKWLIYSYDIVATGNEEYLFIGDFQNSPFHGLEKDKSYISYFLIDSVAIREKE